VSDLLLTAIVGWIVAVLMMGLWLGERRMRIFVQNYTTFGGTPLKKAVVFSQPDAEDAIEDAIDRIHGIAGTKKVARQPSAEDAKFTQETLQNGIDWLIHEAKENGQALTYDQATEEALRMLNAEGTEM
jgi:hypothetical protein